MNHDNFFSLYSSTHFNSSSLNFFTKFTSSFNLSSIVDFLPLNSATANVDFLNFPGDPVFTSETTPIGMGKVTLELYRSGSVNTTVSFITSGGTVIKKDPSFPGTITLDSETDPVFIEVWRHSAGVIFMRYLGKFS